MTSKMSPLAKNIRSMSDRSQSAESLRGWEDAEFAFVMLNSANETTGLVKCTRRAFPDTFAIGRRRHRRQPNAGGPASVKTVSHHVAADFVKAGEFASIARMASGS